MPGLGTIVNIAAVLVGGGVGLLLKKIMAVRFTDTILQGMGLAVIIIGVCGTVGATFIVIDGGLDARFTLVMVLSLAAGALAGEAVNIEARLEALGRFCEKKFSKNNSNSTFAQGFITASLVFCVGAMAVVGSIEDGVNANGQILFAKSAIDAVTAAIFASTMGIGVLFSAVSVGLYQGLITLLSAYIAPYLDDGVIAQMSLTGSVLIAAIGFNMLKMAKIKVGNLLPAIFVPVLFFLVRLIFNF
ncbi:MAG: DUF554 domain-containing protein [Defluviitaleaceae bacterium]|nr:DUF554 domain-containing protein [Defluviitaleaceae bacterium]